MALDPKPFFIGIPGVQHSGEVVRQHIHDSTGGGEGVSSPTSMQVTASPAPDGNVRIAPGGAILLSRYAGATGQSYSARNATETTLAVPPTGSGGGRTDLVILRIVDPQYEGQMPADVNAFQYTRIELIQGVADTVKYAWQLNLTYPAIALARIKRVLNKTIVEPGDITNLRDLAQPRSYRRLFNINPTANHPIPAGYSSWPILSAQRPVMFIPPWGTVLKIVGHYGGIDYQGSTVSVAGIRTGFGSEASENGIIIERTPGRGHYTVSGTHNIPANMRGMDQLINVQAQRSSGTAVWEADYQSQIVIDCEVTEATV